MDPQTPERIENVLRALKEKIKELEDECEAAKAALTQLLARYFDLAPLNIDIGIEQYKVSSGRYEELKAELSTAKELQSIIEQIIKELKKKKPKSKEALGDTEIAEPTESPETSEGPSKGSWTAAKKKKAKARGRPKPKRHSARLRSTNSRPLR